MNNSAACDGGIDLCLLKSIGAAGLTAGVLDAAAGVVVFDFALHRMTIVQVLQWIASGALGPKAFDGGLTTAFIGNLLHFVIAYGWTVGYYAVYRSIGLLGRKPILSGLLYGALIWAAMNLIVLPYFSRVPPAPFEAGVAAVGLAWHMALVGLPIALFAKSHFDRAGN